jgi:hypothetical protein
MTATTTQSWFLKAATAFTVVMTCCWAMPLVLENIPDFPPITTDRQQFVVFDKYFHSPARPIALVGSSLTFRLREEYFEHRDVRNVALPGGSALTGLAVFEAMSARRPRVIAVETNILSRGVDEGLLRELQTAKRSWKVLKPFRTMAALYQGMLYSETPLDRSWTEAVRKTPAATYDTGKYIEQTLSEWNKPSYEPIILRDATTVKDLVVKLEQLGVIVFLFELPMSPELDPSLYVKATRKSLKRVFGPSDDRWINLEYPIAELRWTDGAHLDERSAIIMASALERAIAIKLSFKSRSPAERQSAGDGGSSNAEAK